jgi:nucleotide-binding universal stress UspA family protein
MFQRILVGTDGSGTAAAAVEHAAELAKASGAELLVLTAYHQPADAAPPFQMAPDFPGAEVSKGILQDVERRYGGEVKLRTLSIEASPTDALIETADREKVDLVVVGNRGMGGAKRLVLGSVPNAISHHAPCHVLIVHTSDE